VQCSAVQCSAVQCSAVQCSDSATRLGASTAFTWIVFRDVSFPVPCSAVLCSAVQCSAVQCSAVLCSAVLLPLNHRLIGQKAGLAVTVGSGAQYFRTSITELVVCVGRSCGRAVQCGAVQCRVVLCSAVWCSAVLCSAVWCVRGGPVAAGRAGISILEWSAGHSGRPGLALLVRIHTIGKDTHYW
jgi:hypothetical protein